MTLADAAATYARAEHLDPITTHATCNRYLRALRSGSRRRAHHQIRVALRRLREAAAKGCAA